jgi:hypothetical protein
VHKRAGFALVRAEVAGEGVPLLDREILLALGSFNGYGCEDSLRFL